MPHPSTIGMYLLDRLKELGVEHIFGVPGDYNLGFLDAIELDHGVKWIGTCNELNAAYAADGYARMKGAGALVTTMGVGELSAINGIAGSYAEHVPVVQITGGPALHAINAGALVHHTLGDGNFTHFGTIAREVTVAQATLTPENARTEIDRVLRTCWLQKRPVQIYLPADVCAVITEPPASPLVFSDYESDPTTLEHFMTRALAHIASARHPAILADYEVERFHLVESFRQFVQKTGLPFALLSMGKGMIDETQAQYLGIYQGALSDPTVRERIEESDCLLCIGVKWTDVATGGFSHHLDTDNIIEIHPEHACIEEAVFQNVAMKDVLEQLMVCLPHRESLQLDTLSYKERGLAESGPWEPRSATPLKQSRFWQAVSHFLGEGDVLLAEQGTPFYGALTLSLPAKASLIGQPLWASIGYTLPALLGTLLAAPLRRQILVIGDGSLQMTVQELSTILRQGLSPVILLINNHGYTVERVIHRREQPYHDIQMWQYHQLPALFGASHPYVSMQVANEEGLDHALRCVDQHAGVLCFIEVKMSWDDAPENLRRLGKIMALRNGFAEEGKIELETSTPLAAIE